MKTLNRRDFPGAQYPERIIQFGEGNFLRAFVDWQIDLLNEHTDLNSGVVVVRPIETSFPPSLSTQDGLYTTIIRGLNEKGEAVSDARLIRSVNREISVYSEYDEFLKLAHNPEMRFVFSNTTEAGISYHAGDKFDDAPAVSYPAKLTRLLFERFSHFNGALDKGWIIIPCELIDYNGDALRELVLRYAQEWALPEAFIQWLDQANSFCSTLVDRIVTGYPRDEVAKLEEELGYHDGFLDTAEHSAVLAGCERIAYTPIPFAYTLILHRTVYLFCIMLPFALVVDLHYMTPFISVLISYTFISLDCLAEELEDPFGTENNDLPLDAICNAIEIDLLQMNDEAEIPAKILPDRHYQLT
ncbi:tagaturonate reductase [Escherichia coli]|nr:tagaturonate reductase [Escherichia coli]